MSSFVNRYDDDTPPRSLGSALTDLFARCLAPAVPWFAIVVAVGWVIVNVFHDGNGEDQLNRDLQQGRTPAWDTLTQFWSGMASTIPTIVIACGAMVVVLLITRKWWIAVLPVVAVSLQAAVFLLVTVVTDRQRPDVPHLDPAPPTSSYPSGHMGAATALYLTFALLSQRIQNDVLRRVLTTLFLLLPLVVGFSRLYRGMHHPSDVLMGGLNGLVAAVLAWRYLARREHGRDHDETRVSDS